MAKIAFQIDFVPTFRGIGGRWETASKELFASKRDMIRVQGRAMQEHARTEAPKGRTGKFSAGIRFRTFARGAEELGFTISTPQPLGRWIMEGTAPHAIVARNAKALRFLWEKGPRSSGAFTAYHFYVSVWHPGTKPNPFMQRAYRRWLPGARADLRKISRDFVRTFADQGAAKVKA
jgi:hypothetical protein